APPLAARLVPMQPRRGEDPLPHPLPPSPRELPPEPTRALPALGPFGTAARLAPDAPPAPGARARVAWSRGPAHPSLAAPRSPHARNRCPSRAASAPPTPVTRTHTGAAPRAAPSPASGSIPRALPPA